LPSEFIPSPTCQCRSVAVVTISILVLEKLKSNVMQLGPVSSVGYNGTKQGERETSGPAELEGWAVEVRAAAG